MIETTKLDIDGHSIHVEMSGSGQPLMLINGLGGDPRNLVKLRDHLSGYRLIVYDPPGVGKSSDISLPIRMPGHAKIAAKVLRSIDVESASVLGVSWGGAVAQEIANQHPEVVSKLVLVSTTPGHFLMVSPKVLFNRYVKMVVGSKTDWMQIGAIFGWTSMGYLRKLQHHTLIVSGGNDDLVLPYNARLLHSLIPNSELKLIDDEDHWLVINKAEALASMINDFIN